MSIIITNGKIITCNEILTGYSIYVKDKKISKILRSKDIKKIKDPNLKKINAGNRYISPGLIDVHIQGFKGYDVWDNKKDSISKMSHSILFSGTTSYLATTHYDEPAIEHILRSVRKQADDEAEILGIHMEDPFINHEKTGMIPRNSIRPFNSSNFKKVMQMTRGKLKLMTIAPENKNSAVLIRKLKKEHVVIAMGHTKADYAAAMKGIDQGITQATHLFNAMEPVGHRSPNAVTAALIDSRVFVQVIADGIHIHPAILNVILKAKTPDRIILITDAVKAAGLKSGVFMNYGIKVRLEKGAVLSADGKLAGSALSLLEAVKNIIRFTGVTLVDAVKMASLVPARSINIHHQKGEIAEGKDADLIIFDKKFKVKKVIKNEKVIRV